jgi:hypothetical protein
MQPGTGAILGLTGAKIRLTRATFETGAKIQSTELITCNFADVPLPPPSEVIHPISTSSAMYLLTDLSLRLLALAIRERGILIGSLSACSPTRNAIKRRALGVTVNAVSNL